MMDRNQHRRRPAPVASEGFVIDRKPSLKKVVRSIVNVTWLIANTIAAICFVMSAYAYIVPPTQFPKATLVAMSFPAFFWLVVALFVIDIIWWRRTAWVPGMAMLACVGQISDYMPLQFPHLGMNDEEKAHSFTLMTYNVAAFADMEHPDIDHNRQIEYILQKDPDICCIQEAWSLNPPHKNTITQEQRDSLHSHYPYVMIQGQNFAMLSKFPITPINLDFPKKEFASGDISGWRAQIHGKVVNIFSVHLRSFSLSDEDKGAYQGIVKLDSINRSDLADARSSIVPKVAEASIDRAGQIAYLEKYLQRYGGKNAIVVGDFNDTENSYAVQSLCHDCHMRQFYSEVGFFPMITFNASSLYFRIDHILYRGDLEPWKLRRGNLKASDHYPLLATFLLN